MLSRKATKPADDQIVLGHGADGLRLEPAVLDESSFDTTKAAARAFDAEHILRLATQRSQVNDR